MKFLFFKKIAVLSLLIMTVSLIVISCTKDTDGSPQYKAGTPVATNGIRPDSGSGGTTLTLEGTGLGQMRSIVFSTKNVPAPFISTLNTEEAIIFRVPDTAYGGNQNITLTNVDGKSVTVPFRVLAYPVVSSAFPMDFQAGSTVTLTGSNLDDVTSVVINGTTDAATIVSKTRGQMVITMPASNVNRGFLKITNATGPIVTTQEFVNVSKALTVFSDQLDNGFESWSWGGDFSASTEEKITGPKSLKAAYDPAGTWGGMQLGNGGSIDITGYKYFAFWVKGAEVDWNVQFWLNWGNQKVITIPAKKWTYFRYELATDYAGVSSTINNVTFQIQNEGKTFYFDNLMFFK